MRHLLRLLLATLLLAACSGCTTLHSWAQFGNGAPHFGTSVDIPLGSGGGGK